MFKVVSLFSGCGGSDLGIEGGFTFLNGVYSKLPFKIELAIEIDKKAVKTYSENFPHTKILCDDIKNIDSNSIPDHDVLIGGFPCQSFSTVNPTKDPFDERANLYIEMVRILRQKKPKVFIAENVKGMMTLHGGKILERICSEFSNAGYKVKYELLNSADYGVPQKRPRVFIVGIRDDINLEYSFPPITHSSIGVPNNWVPIRQVIDSDKIVDKKYYFSERAVLGMKNAKDNMKRGLAQNVDLPSLTITSHLAKVSINSRDPVLLVDKEKEIYRRFTPREAARIQSFPESFKFIGSDADAYRQIGNAIPPVMFWHISRSILKLLN